MSRPARRLATYADLFDLPDHGIGQVVNGVLHAQPRPAIPHARVSSTLGMDLGSAYR